jgi:hypothetical protein
MIIDVLLSIATLWTLRKGINELREIYRQLKLLKINKLYDVS